MAQNVTNDWLSSLLLPWLWPLTATKALLNVAPQSLSQPILPNWTFGAVYNVTEDNSSAPETELEVIKQHSYGRQLGRITDALSVVVRSDLLNRAELSGADRNSLEGFTELVKSIEEIKASEAIKRTQRLAAELKYLKGTRPDIFERAVGLLEAVTAESPKPLARQLPKQQRS